MRLSLRELLLFVGAVSIGVPALFYGGSLTSGIIVTIVSLIVLGMAIRTLVERGEYQALAIGFMIAAVGYASLVLTSWSDKSVSGQWLELNPYRGSLPTTHALRPLLEVAQRQRTYYVTPQGKDTRDPPPQGTQLFGGSGGGGFGAGGNSWRIVSRPETESFMATGHALWTLILGCAGAKYAVWIYRRRIKRHTEHG